MKLHKSLEYEIKTLQKLRDLVIIKYLYGGFRIRKNAWFPLIS